MSYSFWILSKIEVISSRARYCRKSNLKNSVTNSKKSQKFSLACVLPLLSSLENSGSRSIHTNTWWITLNVLSALKVMFTQSNSWRTSWQSNNRFVKLMTSCNGGAISLKTTPRLSQHSYLKYIIQWLMVFLSS